MADLHPVTPPSPAAPGTAPGRVAWILTALLSLAGCIAAAALVPGVAAGETVRIAWPWVPALGVSLALAIDGLALLFLLLITGTGFFVSLYAGAYLAGHPRRGRFFAFLLAFEVAMLGLVSADDLITLFVFWELTTLSSYFLIGFDHDSATARRNAWQALLVTGMGGLALMAGFILLADAGGSWQISALTAGGDAIRADPLYVPILVLVLVGAFTKSAQVPFHFWLPNAMAAPTPVSAYLHSATMVKAGIYLLARLHPALGGTPGWIWTLTLVGAVTAVWAAIVALRQTDLKLSLAHTTVMALGTLTLFLAGTSQAAIAAAMTFLIVHALYKCGLFLVVGILDHETGSRDAERLGGLARAMPITAIAAALAAFSMAGFPPFLGFIGKELKYEGALAIASEPVFAACAAVTANALMVAIAGIVAVRPFYGPRLPTARPPHDPKVAMWLGPLTLAALGLAFGLVPPVAGRLLVEPAVTAILGTPVVVKLALWHGINLPLLLSIVTFVSGLGIYRWHRPLRAALGRAFDRLPITADGAYDRVVAATLAAARLQTRLLQGGSLRRYLLVVFATTAAAVGGTLVSQGGVVWPTAWPAIGLAEWGIVALIAVAALLPVVTRARLTAICGLGVVGAGIALIFLLYGAPDVAMTQLLVEILFVVLIAIILLKIPDLTGPGHPGRGAPIRDAIVAGAVGLTITLVLFAVLDVSVSSHLNDYFTAASVPEGHGRNIVNVILVDFRALDTLGEIVVVAVAAIGAYAVIKLRPTREAGKAAGKGAGKRAEGSRER